MVSWKERGVVPDSDDEDDCDGSGLQGRGLDDTGLESRNNAGKSRIDGQIENGQDYDREASRLLPPSSPANVNTSSVLDEFQPGTAANDASLSPYHTFEVPRNLLDFNELPQLHNTSPGPGLNADDEISKTYILLSSPLSSLPLSPALSHTSDTVNLTNARHFTDPENQNASPSAGRSWHAATLEEIERTYQGEDWPSTNRRSLRQRNPIQLHPYALEGEKYRQTLMARGMRPLRLAQPQDRGENAPLDEAPSDVELETQGESQSNDISESPLSSSLILESLDESQQIHNGDDLHPSRHSLQLSANGIEMMDADQLMLCNNYNTPRDVEDEEFPDIDKLLNKKTDVFPNRSAKRRRITYGSRYTSRLPSGAPISTRHITREQMETTSRIGRVNAPPSPPATSSPFPISNHPRVSGDDWFEFHRLGRNRTASLECGSPNENLGPRTLVTPTTDTAKHVIDLTAEERHGGVNSATDSETIDVSSTSELDESVEVRSAGKKIRGVLPASWLRLDDHARRGELVQISRRQNRNPTPEKAALRRGVAIHKHTSNNNSPATKRTRTDSHFMLDDSEDDEDDELPGFVAETADDTSTSHTFTQQDEASVYEDDHIDAMLPPQSRQTRLPSSGARRKKPGLSAALFTHNHLGRSYQPRITEHLVRPRNMKLNTKGRSQPMIRTRNLNSLRGRTSFIRTHDYHVNVVPRLSILDFIQPQEGNCEHMPNFIRIAARTAKSRIGLGRHSPTRKFIRLATREDTQEAQSVLREWRAGTIRPRLETSAHQGPRQHRRPLGDLSYNVGAQSCGSQGHSGAPYLQSTEFPGSSTGVTVSKPSMQLETSHPIQRQLAPIIDENRKGRSAKPVRPTRPLNMGTRPAQLEMSPSDYRSRHPNVAFTSTKKTLDILYKKSHRGSAVRGDIQLARFLGDDIESISGESSSNRRQELRGKPLLTPKNIADQPSRRQKRAPNRIDARAAVYRQPSEPLVLDSIEVLEAELPIRNEGKLLGLGKFGTVYTYHFDILPLDSGVFFHESTFIGSGALSKVFALSAPQARDSGLGHTLYRLGEKQLRWGTWDDTVSSELGVCFDWINDQFESANTVSEIEGGSLIDCLTFIINYVQGYLTFPDQGTCKTCLSRFSEVLQNFANRLDIQRSKKHHQNVGEFRVLVESSTLGMVLVFQLLRFSQMSSLELEFTNQFEILQQRISRTLICLLLAAGLETVRKLYDDLQYLAFREAGIRSDRYVIQSWVVAIQILRAARIPRGSFWDIFNHELINIHGAELTNARVLERIWYSMFSLLPLTEFDGSGVTTVGLRLSISFDNWALPQMMAKKTFELYGSKSRQSPSFNDYCRALFNRCSFLMQTWGWRKHSSIVGTFFDFFATHKLAHLRNEEVYSSPAFLENLDRNPSLTVDPDDRCFHILLKIIAVSLKQMARSGDLKGVRNLVTRVLPNHDRQYPKEQKILQRDLASLRNHHDLLCTLFWAAPSELRPPMSLIRVLVDPGNAHREANLINMRAWENLARFILATTPTAAAYLPLATWHLESFNKLLAQHKSVEKDAEGQLKHLTAAAKQLLSQQTILSMIQENKTQIVMAMVRQMDALKVMIELSKDMNGAKLVFCDESCTVTITETLNYFNPRYDYDWPMVEAALNIIQIYTSRLNTLVPASEASHDDSGVDSQEFGSDIFSETDIARIEYTGELNGKVLTAVRHVLHTALQPGTTVNALYIEKIVDTWALLAGTHIMTKLFTLADFDSESGALSEVRLDHPSGHVRHYAAYFLRRLAVVTENRLDMQVPPMPLYLGE